MIASAPTYFDVLGVTPDADAAAIKRAWRARLRATHPDHGGSREQFDAVQDAWQVLSDPHRAQMYRRRLVSPTPPPAPANEAAPGPRPSTPGRVQDDTPGTAPPDQLWRWLWAGPLGSAALAVALCLAAAAVAVTSLASGTWLLLTGDLLGRFSAGTWWLGTALVTALMAQVMVIARDPHRPARAPRVLGVALSGVLLELLTPFLNVSGPVTWAVALACVPLVAGFTVSAIAAKAQPHTSA